MATTQQPGGGPQWYRDAIIYQLHIKAFFDSDGNGIGDLRGLIAKLDYLQHLGITAVWLLPFYPSPLRDDGYDIADYYNVNEQYNSLADFRRFLREAHRRDLRVITELVLNHTSDQHPWFQRARRAKPGSSHRNFYVWSESPERYRDARIIFQDFESSNWSWDPVAKAYFWHRFYAHQPDLNFEHPRVQKEMLRVIDFWFGMGVDGVRLDAVPYLFEREGTNCENLPETHAFLKKLRAHLDERFEDRMLLAEANQWPEDAAAYFGEGDECQMAFHFPIMPRMYMALQMEDRFPLVDILEQTPAIPENCQWAIFLRNHDELTLEMVTDEERDYMYRVYASDPRARINLGIRRRLAPLLANNRRRIELMNILLFSLPGTPVIYYGDEIGMGDNYYLGDRDGVRTPMQWSPDRNAGFSRASPQRLYLPAIIEPEYHFESLNVENQERNPSSLLWWMRRVIAMRKRVKAFGRGTIEMLYPDNPKVLAFVRRHEEDTLLVVVNLSRFSQVVQLNLAGYAGQVPVEVFSRNRFPVIRETPYVLTLGIHDYYWFSLRQEREETGMAKELPALQLASGQLWPEVLEGKAAERLCELLAGWLPRCRWFRSKARTISRIGRLERIPLGKEPDASRMLLVEVSFTEGASETYALPLAWLPMERSSRSLLEDEGRAGILRLRIGEQEGLLYDATFEQGFRDALFSLLRRRGKLRTDQGELAGIGGARFRELLAGRTGPLASRVLKAEQSNSSILYEDRFFLKLYRRPEQGLNPDPELCRFLTEKTRFEHLPPFAATLEYRRPAGEPMVLALLQGFVPNQGDAWEFSLDALERFIERVLTRRDEPLPDALCCRGLLDCDINALPNPARELFGSFYLEMAALLGRRTAEMHLALAGNSLEPALRPEAFSTLYQRSAYQSMRSLATRNLALLSQALTRLPEEDRELARYILAAKQELLERFGRILEKKIPAMKIRIHGDYHLGQVLFTGKDFMIIDFEGEPARTLGERRLKRSALRDVAGMLRSFHYAAYCALKRHARNQPQDSALLEPWLQSWNGFAGGTFLGAYRRRLGNSPLLPQDEGDFSVLLEAFVLDKALYELGYELNNRPGWASIPLKGIEMILKETGV